MTDTVKLQRQQVFRGFKQLKKGVSTCADTPDAGTLFIL